MSSGDKRAGEPLLGPSRPGGSNPVHNMREHPQGSFRALAMAGVVALCLGLLLATVTRVGGMLGRWHTHAEAPRMAGWFPFRDVSGHVKDCSSKEFTKSTLKVLAEYPIARMVNGSLATFERLGKFEASDVAARPGSESPFYVVLDNSFSILRVGQAFHDVPGSGNELMQWPDDDGSDSQFEALAYNMTSDSFVAVQEVVELNGELRPRMFDIKFSNHSTVRGNSMCLH